MLKVIIELHPYGDSETAHEISSFFIGNDGTGTPLYVNFIKHSVFQ